VIDLEGALVDLAEHLDHPAGDHLAADVRRRIATPARVGDRRSTRVRVLLAFAAALLLIAIAVVAIPPSREAIADWLGIGAVDIRRSGQPPARSTGGSPVPGQPGSPRDRDALARLAAARRKVHFTIATPLDGSVGALFEVQVDSRPTGGLVSLTYERFTLVEVASMANQRPQVGKTVGPTTHLEYVTVHGRQAAWIVGGGHEIAYLDRSGNLDLDTVRRSGPVLLWERGGVTYRIEGIAMLSQARRVAESLR
jgi:hypothetical protein